MSHYSYLARLRGNNGYSLSAVLICGALQRHGAGRSDDNMPLIQNKKVKERRKKTKESTAKIPAHLVEEAVGLCHSVQLVFVLL